MSTQLEKPSLKIGKYRHFKGNKYQVIDLVKHSETEEWLVLYKPLYGDRSLWVRPFALFSEKVHRQGEWVKRFQYVGS